MSGAWKMPNGGRSTRRAVRAHRAEYPDPPAFAAGDVLAVEDRETVWSGWLWCVTEEGKGCWVPEDYIERRGESCTALRDYDSVELDVDAGDVLEVREEAGGWLWCVDREGKSGWVPAVCVEPCEEG